MTPEQPAWEAVDWHPFWVSPFPRQPLQSPVRAYDLYTSATFEHQHRPLTAVVASPDPHGRRLRVIDHWSTAHLGLAIRPLPRLELGFVSRLSVMQRGAGTAALASRSARDGAPARPFGDGQLWLRFVLVRRGNLEWLLLQRWTLPWGARHSWLHGPFTYAPALAAQLSVLRRLQLGARLGVRLRRAARYGTAHFGSEAEAELNWYWQAFARWSLGGALTLLPALASDELSTRAGVQRVRRVPAELAFHSGVQLEPLSLQLGAATSLPLSSERGDLTSARFAGPPGPRWRVWLRAARSW